jgi:hypothetical protein
MIKAGESEPFFVEQRAVQFSVKDCRELLKLLGSLEAVKFDKAPATVSYRSVSATYGDFRFRKADDGHVEIFAYAAAAGEIWAAVDLTGLTTMISGLVDQMEGFAKSPQTISLK